MILFLGMSVDVGDFQPVNIPDGYPVADVVAILPDLWWGEGDPLWVASDNPELAAAAAELYGGVPVHEVSGDGFSVVPAG